MKKYFFKEKYKAGLKVYLTHLESIDVEYINKSGKDKQRILKKYSDIFYILDFDKDKDSLYFWINGNYKNTVPEDWELFELTEKELKYFKSLIKLNNI